VLDKLFFISLVLSMTGLFRFLAPQLGTSIAQISLALLAFNLFYLVNRLSYLQRIFPKMLPWFVLLLVWPLVTVTYAPTIEVRQIGIAISRFTLFAGAAVYFISSGPPAIYRVFLVSLVVTAIGIVLNMAIPEYFEAVALLSDARVTSMNRPGGFFMQPNTLAIGMAFMLIGWLAFAKRNTVFFEPMAVLVFVGFQLLTGSRAGLILALLIVALHFGFQWRSTLSRSRRVRKFLIRMTIFAASIFFGLIGMKLFVAFYGGIVEVLPGGLIDRMSNMLEFRLHDDRVATSESFSILDRFEAQKLYWELIKERPFFGHGFEAQVEYLNNGFLYKSAHSTVLSVVMMYGVFYPLFFLALLARLFFNPNRKMVEVALGTNTIVQFLAVALILFLYSGDLFGRYTFMSVFGVVFVVSSFPSFIFRKHAKPVGRLRAYPGGPPTRRPRPGAIKRPIR